MPKSYKAQFAGSLSFQLSTDLTNAYSSGPNKHVQTTIYSKKKIMPTCVFSPKIRFKIFPKTCIFTYIRWKKNIPPTRLFRTKLLFRTLEYLKVIEFNSVYLHFCNSSQLCTFQKWVKKNRENSSPHRTVWFSSTYEWVVQCITWGNLAASALYTVLSFLFSLRLQTP